MRPCHQATCRLYQCADPSWCEQYQKQCLNEDCINISRCQRPYYCQDYEPISAIKPPEQVIIYRHSDLSKQEHDILQQTTLRVQHLEKRLAEFQARKRPRGKY